MLLLLLVRVKKNPRADPNAGLMRIWMTTRDQLRPGHERSCTIGYERGEKETPVIRHGD
jgi:hypothetical protein